MEELELFVAAHTLAYCFKLKPDAFAVGGRDGECLLFGQVKAQSAVVLGAAENYPERVRRAFVALGKAAHSRF